ncbi:hypothetical protein [Streptomyces sp. SD31]
MSQASARTRSAPSDPTGAILTAAPAAFHALLTTLKKETPCA